MADTPSQCALAGFSAASGARVVAHHEVDDYAAVYVMTSEPGRGDLLVIAHRDGETWTALCSGDAGWTWVGFPDDGTDNDDEPNNSELGVLAGVGDLDQPGTVTVELDGRAVTATVDLPHWAALFTGVDADSLSRVQVRNQD